MIEQSTIQFLKDLEENNNRDWFNDNRKSYEIARDNFSSFIEELILDIQKIDNFITDATPKNTIFRIFKDVRFSKNKDPYKTHFGAAISKGGRKSEYPGYYIHIKPNGGTFIGGGIYHAQPSVLKSIRNEIAYNAQNFDELISNKDFVKAFGELEGDKLSRPPKGFDKEHPAIEHIKRKDFLMIHQVEDKLITQPNFNRYCLEQFAKMRPLNEFFRGPVYDVLESND